MNQQLNDLERQLNEISRQQQRLQAEIQQIQKVIIDLKEGKIDEKVEIKPVTQPIITNPPVTKSAPTPVAKVIKPQPKKRAMEDFIGTNLLNKVGIAVLVIGISFGVKYAIDHQMLDPLTRIILGYLAGAAIIGFALKLKKNYHAFSAVLLSGGMASLYFITFAAYNFYEFIPQTAAFILMVAFTAFTVFAAMQYNLQLVAVIGLVGAYAVPFMLSDGSGRVLILFSYMTVINVGILVISFLRTWRVLFALAFALTWIIYGSWMVSGYQQEKHFWLSLTFATAFFILFYIAFLVGKFLNRVKLTIGDISLVLLNCFIYFGSGYAVINNHPQGEIYLGLFTVVNAVIHFGVAVFIYKRLQESKDTFYFVAGLVLSFLTLAVPVQLEGNWVTLIWALESCLLFWIGRSKKFTTYELLSYPLLGLSFLSLLHDWQSLSLYYSDYIYYDDVQLQITPLFNIYFLTTLLVASAFAYFTWFVYQTGPSDTSKILNAVLPILKYLTPIMSVLILYVGFSQEVSLYFTQLFKGSAIKTQGVDGYTDYNYDWKYFRGLWLINYSFIYFGLLWLANRLTIHHPIVNKVLLGVNSLIILIFLSTGLNNLESLRLSYLLPSESLYHHGFWNIGIRYICYGIVAAVLFINYLIASREAMPPVIHKIERLVCHFAILTMLSSELLSLLELNGVDNGFKLALTLLWGSYALYLIIWGFAKEQSYLRVAGIVLFASTLLKLFFYDMDEMGTIAKTIVLMGMGVLLLVASFVYNKRKRKAEETTSQTNLPHETND